MLAFTTKLLESLFSDFEDRNESIISTRLVLDVLESQIWFGRNMRSIEIDSKILIKAPSDPLFTRV